MYDTSIEAEFDTDRFDDAVLAEALDGLDADSRAFQAAVRAAEARLDESEYDLEFLKDAMYGPVVEGSGEGAVVRFGFDDYRAEFFEFGTSAHTIEGDPLSFVWEDPPQWVRDEFDQARGSGGRFESGWRVFFESVDVDGVDEVRFMREALRVLAREAAAESGARR
jgi:hypothetical protein